MNKRNPRLTSPITPRIRARIACGRCREARVSATIHPVRMNVHSSREPSCPPQMAAKRYWRGSAEFELAATYWTEKSLVAKA